MKFRVADIYWLIFCIAAFIFLLNGARSVINSSTDFIPVYTGARCILYSCNPYDSSQLEQQYLQQGGNAAVRPDWSSTPPLYPPSTLLLLAPLAQLRFPAARMIWFLLNGCLFTAAAGLLLSMCPQSQRWIATLLLSFILAGSSVLLMLGNPAIFASSLLIIGCYLFLRDRCLPLGAVLLALSLAAKPQIGGLIVLYLLARRIHWRFTLAAIAGSLTILFFASLILSLHPQSSDWRSTLKANITSASAPDGVDDPRPTNNKHQHAIAMTNLQAITAVFTADARKYDLAAYAIFLALLTVMIASIMRIKAGHELHLISIGALAALTLTPVYHRFYDTRMLIITVPAAVIVYQKRRLLGAVIGALTALAIVSVQDRIQKFLLIHQILERLMPHKFLFVLLLRQQNLELPLLFCLYMYAAFTIRYSGSSSNGNPAEHPREALSQ